jgi:predicted ATP-dependent endonuclease of OLD family
MEQAMLENFHVQNFRALKDVTIEKTARINLIVGGNNVGKTSLLEAMRMLTGSMADAINLHAAFRFGVFQDDFWFGVNRVAVETIVAGKIDGETIRRRRARIGGIWSENEYLDYSLVVNSSPFEPRALLQQYQNAYDEGVKSKLLTLLKKIDPSIRSLEQARLLGDGWTIKFENDAPNPVDISSMGQGFIRAFGLYCQLLAGKKQIALIDEVEIGMHRDSLPVLWGALRDASEAANIQIFATTHSYECIQAAAATFKERPDLFQLIRLIKTDDGIKALCFSGEEIEAAIEYGAEVR